MKWNCGSFRFENQSFFDVRFHGDCYSAAVVSVLLALSVAAADDKPQAGLDPQRLGKIQQRMQEYVNAGEAAGLQSRNPMDSIRPKYFLKDRLGQVQSTHLLAFHDEGLAGRQEFPVTHVSSLPFGQRIQEVGVCV